MHRLTTHLPIVLILLFSYAIPGLAQSSHWTTAGVRAGIGDNRNSEDFSQYEAYFTYGLPWTWQSDSHWTLGTFIGVNAGVVVCEGEAFIASIGPGLFVMTPNERFTLSAGIAPTYISDSVFGTDDFGATVQFTSFIGVNVNFLENWAVGYRAQHMSNAGISSENPGLNHHMVELGYRF